MSPRWYFPVDQTKLTKLSSINQCLIDIAEPFASNFIAFPISARNLGIELEQTPLGNHQIRHGKQRKDLCGVLGQSPISSFLVSEQVFDVVKRMLNLGPNTGLGFFDLFIQSSALSVR